MGVRVDFNHGEVARVGTDAAEQQIKVVTNRILNLARAKVGVDTGKLRASLTATVERRGDQVVGTVGSNLDYAIHHHEGHGVIYPRNGRFLAWPAVNNSGIGNRRFSGGRTSGYVFARKVRAVPGNPFLRDALREVMGQ